MVSAEKNYTGDWDKIGYDFINSLDVPIIDHSDYLKMVIINLFSKITGMDHIDSLLRDYDGSNPYVKRKIVKAAARAGLDYWLREKREDFPTLDPWLRRAFIFGAYALPNDEKTFWLNKIKKSDNMLERIIANWVLKNDPNRLLDFEDPFLYSDEDSDENTDEEYIPKWAHCE